MASVRPLKSGSGSPASPGGTRARLRAATGLGAMTLLVLLAAALAMPRLADSQEAPPGPRFELAARVALPHGFVREAAWLDQDNYLALVLSPDGAAVWKMGYTEPSRLKFMSSSFLEERVCPAQYAPRLTWVVSPEKRYICFMWFLDDGSRAWELIDISEAPAFKIKRFTPPAGMAVAKALFSPDDRYLVLVHDSLREGSPASVVALDLEQGVEAWRIGTHELNFVSELWWGGAVFDAPRFACAASLHEGQFYEDPGLAVCEIATQKLSFTPQHNSLLFGAEALWGKSACYALAPGAPAPFTLETTVPGERPQGTIALSARPVMLSMLPTPGLVLISNTVDYVTNQLWLVNVLSGNKSQVDSDCASFALASDGKLLVRSQTKSELRIYELAQPGFSSANSAAREAAPAPRTQAAPPGRSNLPIEF